MVYLGIGIVHRRGCVFNCIGGLFSAAVFMLSKWELPERSGKSLPMKLGIAFLSLHANVL